VHIIDANDEDDGSGINPEAERRLYYVALTRARDCCVAWTSGRTHTALLEAKIQARHTEQALVEAVRSSSEAPSDAS
jgi:DNA helicase II / ATP-dependent DNA helicase PcrA